MKECFIFVPQTYPIHCMFSRDITIITGEVLPDLDIQTSRQKLADILGKQRRKNRPRVYLERSKCVSVLRRFRSGRKKKTKKGTKYEFGHGKPQPKWLLNGAGMPFVRTCTARRRMTVTVSAGEDHNPHSEETATMTNARRTVQLQTDDELPNLQARLQPE